jgi:hypothetical protein
VPGAIGERDTPNLLKNDASTSDYMFIAAGTSAYDDATTGGPIYFIPPYTNETGPATDANGGFASSKIDFDYAVLILTLPSQSSPGSTLQASTEQY